MKLSELARLIGANIIVTQKFDIHTKKWSEFSVDFEGTTFIEFKERLNCGVLSSVYGIGSTKNKALHNFVSNINDYSVVVLNASSGNRMEFCYDKITV
jgi:hypothetical protein